MATASEILALAASYIGTKESPVGSNNVIFNTHYYGGPVNDESLHWCVVFVWDIFRMAGASELFYGGNKTASCTTLHSYHAARGQAVPVDELQPGDIAFFDFSGRRRVTQHVGIVESVEGGYVTTIDGNTGTTSEANGGAVMRRRRELRFVSRAYRPAYEKEDEDMTQEQFDTMMNDWLKRQAELPPSEWSAEAREWAEEHGIINGDESGNKQYKKPCTREELVQILHNYTMEG